jgi:hypothetical protein
MPGTRLSLTDGETDNGTKYIFIGETGRYRFTNIKNPFTFELKFCGPPNTTDSDCYITVPQANIRFIYTT